MVAIFTHDTPNLAPKQVQSLAYSTDRGRSWTKHSGNPVLLPPGDHKDFRDPKVFWFDDGARAHWVMALAVASEIWFFHSPDLKTWTESSRFGAAYGSHTGVWECPELVQLDVEGTNEKRWVLFVSVGQGAPAGGSGVQYFVGAFDGGQFVPQDPASRTRWVDHGADFYAPQAWNDAPEGRKLWLGWMNNWSYANQIPDAGGWRGSLSTARALSLKREGQDVVLRQQPLTLGTLTRQADFYARRIAASVETVTRNESTALPREIRVTFAVDAATTSPYFGIKLRRATGGAVVIGYNVRAERLLINRIAAGPALPGFSVPHLAPLAARDGKIVLHLLIDESSVEVFADDGRVVMTEQFFADPPIDSLAVFADDGVVLVESVDLGE